ncbi:MAG: alpha-amylase [Candidatus Pacebacteria bacterium]|nr:alpha-amylase [Candidatus Paceibacterota bacterium]
MNHLEQSMLKTFRPLIEGLYGADESEKLLERLQAVIGRYPANRTVGSNPQARWNEKDALLITYGDMVQNFFDPPLKTLRGFITDHLGQALNTVHILPFFPYSSDDGFAVIDYRHVDPAVGTWEDVTRLSEDVYLAMDLVLNHVSRESNWYRDYTSGILPQRNYFIEVPHGTDLSTVVRPRNRPLLLKTHTREGMRQIWTTFSEDQIDVDFGNPDVLFEFLDILLMYVEKGARIIRLDAIAYLWKKIGTPCIHLPEVHMIVKLMRRTLEAVGSNALLLTETNVPHSENISYFGDGDEAHMVYQFTLPPLLLHALSKGTSKHLTAWAKTVSSAPAGCTYLNFTASHDGIGVRPLEGLIPQGELDALCEGVKERGGYVSTKQNSDGSESPYELNITYFDALADATKPEDKSHIDRFLCSQAIPLALKGIPAVYFNSLIGARNDRKGVAKTGRFRSINRQKWNIGLLQQWLGEPSSREATIFTRYRRLLKVRGQHPAFHPDGAQTVLDLGSKVFGVLRTAPDKSEAIMAISNISAVPATVSLRRWCRNPHRSYGDLISSQDLPNDEGRITLSPYQSVWTPIDTPD